MPNRLIREGLMESEAVLSLPVEGRWLFVIIMLSADDLGLFEATEFKLARRADVNRDLAGRLMSMLADTDLIRLYEVDGKRYGFIPKFRQRVQIKRTKHPLPPAGLLSDDSDASNKIKHLADETTVGQPLENGCAGAVQPSEPEPEPEKKISELPTVVPRRRARKSASTDPVPPCPFDRIVVAYHAALPDLPEVRVMRAGGERQKAIAKFWEWVMTSHRNDGTRRATNTDEGVAWFREYFQRANANDFIMGRVARGPGHEHWVSDIDYLCSERGMKQVLEKTRAV